LYRGENQTVLTKLVIPAVHEKGRFEGELCGQDRSGREFHVHLCLTLLRDPDSAPAGMVGIAIDITDEPTESAPSQNRSRPAATTPPLARREIDGTQFLIASPLMHKFMGMVDRVAGHTETVLVTGETGSGKELVARTIHESSYRHTKPLIDINCAALPEHLVESELFGYEKGAFSGADSSKPGLFELADKSTIFLDEIGELQPQIQVKLLRVLDGAPYYRLGGHRKITVDVRVVAATNQDLELAVKEGRFRKDLFHRLGQFQLRVPPLRERPEDITALAQHFLSLKAPEKNFSSEALAALRSHSWPGNIRELRNLIAKLAMAASDRQITASFVLAELTGKRQTEPQAGVAVPLGNLENMEEQMIIRALENTGGHRAQAAEQLGISRRTLSRKLREYGIDVPAGDRTAPLGTISEEQQKFFRAKVGLPVTLRNAQGKELQAKALNLSTGGMGLDDVADPAAFAGILDVTFLLPESETVMQAKGRLVWADVGGRAGLRFVVVEPRLFEQLQHWTNRKMKDEGWELPY
jgi:DNA-binding NtrC family response regulator